MSKKTITSQLVHTSVCLFPSFFSCTSLLVSLKKLQVVNIASGLTVTWNVFATLQISSVIVLIIKLNPKILKIMNLFTKKKNQSSQVWFYMQEQLSG